MPAYGPEQNDELLAFALHYFRSLFARLRPPFALVLEDYQRLPSDARLADVMPAVLGEVPDGITVVVMSREPPPPVMARLVAHGELGEIGWPHLQLKPGEALALGRRLAAGKADRRRLLELHAQTGGWIVGYVLQLKRMVSGSSELAELRAGDLDTLGDYIAEEVLAPLSEDSVQVLLRLALLPSGFTATQAVRLTGFAQAESLLERLHRRGLFVERSRGPGTVYRFHPPLPRVLDCPLC